MLEKLKYLVKKQPKKYSFTYDELKQIVNDGYIQSTLEKYFEIYLKKVYSYQKRLYICCINNKQNDKRKILPC